MEAMKVWQEGVGVTLKGGNQDIFDKQIVSIDFIFMEYTLVIYPVIIYIYIYVISEKKIKKEISDMFNMYH